MSQELLKQRPNFPKGLKVLLVDCKGKAKEEVQLKELEYEVTSCSSCAEALTKLSEDSKAFDIVLAEAKTVSAEGPERDGFCTAVKHLPLVLITETGSTNEVMKGIELGAVDFLERPLSSLKLRNIWQHVVRKVMSESSTKSSSCGKRSSMEEDRREKVKVCCSGLESPRLNSPTASAADTMSFMQNISCKAFEGESCSESEIFNSFCCNNLCSDLDSVDSKSQASNSTGVCFSWGDEKMSKLSIGSESPTTTLRSPSPPASFAPDLEWGQSSVSCAMGRTLIDGSAFTPAPGQVAYIVPCAPMGSCVVVQQPQQVVGVQSSPMTFIPNITNEPAPINASESGAKSSDGLSSLPEDMGAYLKDVTSSNKKAPIGLSLKKTKSLLDLINQQMSLSNSSLTALF